ncbi:hypothetical protein EDB86DRAFT_2830944 [Lactarius hatsudake]|nr:hypothetical protein EDB86DRAFT_2830944 [Lactarius hatsudake]
MAHVMMLVGAKFIIADFCLPLYDPPEGTLNALHWQSLAYPFEFSLRLAAVVVIKVGGAHGSRPRHPCHCNWHGCTVKTCLKKNLKRLSKAREVANAHQGHLARHLRGLHEWEELGVAEYETSPDASVTEDPPSTVGTGRMSWTVGPRWMWTQAGNTEEGVVAGAVDHVATPVTAADALICVLVAEDDCPGVNNSKCEHGAEVTIEEEPSGAEACADNDVDEAECDTATSGVEVVWGKRKRWGGEKVKAVPAMRCIETQMDYGAVRLLLNSGRIGQRKIRILHMGLVVHNEGSGVRGTRDVVVGAKAARECGEVRRGYTEPEDRVVRSDRKWSRTLVRGAKLRRGGRQGWERVRFESLRPRMSAPHWGTPGMSLTELKSPKSEGVINVN